MFTAVLFTTEKGREKRGEEEENNLSIQKMVN